MTRDVQPGRFSVSPAFADQLNQLAEEATYVVASCLLYYDETFVEDGKHFVRGIFPRDFPSFKRQ
jgi:hypothetical protein